MYCKKRNFFLFEREQKTSHVVMQRFAGTHNKMVVLFLIGKGKVRFLFFLCFGHIREIRCSSK